MWNKENGYKLKQEVFLDQCCLHLAKWSIGTREHASSHGQSAVNKMPYAWNNTNKFIFNLIKGKQCPIYDLII